VRLSCIQVNPKGVGLGTEPSWMRETTACIWILPLCRFGVFFYCAKTVVRIHSHNSAENPF
jgi:hypothetical protein